MKQPQKTERPQSTDRRGSLTADLAARIARAKETREIAERGKNRSGPQDMTGLARGLRLGSEFVAAVLVGAGMGYLLDQWLGTAPWLFLVLMLFGFVAGVLNVVRSAAQMNKAAPLPTDAPKASDETDQ